MQEVIAKRDYNKKYFDLGDGQFKMQSHIGHIHYPDENGDFQEVDYTLEDMGDHWQMVKANYRLYIAKDFGADQLIRFDNKYKGANHTIRYDPKRLAWVNNPDLSDMSTFRNAQAVIGVHNPSDNTIRYTDAFGDGIHFEITLLRSGFTKEIIIDAKNKLELPPTTNHKLVALFRYQGNGLKVLKKNAEAWNKDSYFQAFDGFELEEDALATAKSFIKPAYIFDSSEPKNMENIPVFWKFHNGSLWQAKVLPKAYLNNATYPVRADTTTSYYTGAGDGGVATLDSLSNWANVHADTTGQYPRYTSPTLSDNGHGVIGVKYYAGSDYNITRVFLPVDTSGIDDAATISAASMFVYFWSKEDGDNDSEAYMALVEGTQASTTAVVEADIDNVGSTEWSNQKDITSISTTGYTEFVLNATGISNINLTGTTKIALREGHDIQNISTATASSNVIGYASERTGDSQDPYLEVTYTVSSVNSNFLAFM